MSHDLDILNGILDRRFSCRAYKTTPVPREMVEKIVATAQKVPSWCNSQPWHLTLLQGAPRDRMEHALQEAVETQSHASDIPFPERYSGVYKDRRSECGWQLYDAVGIAKGDRAASAAQMRRNFSFFGAPQVIIVTTPRALGAYGALDCGAFVTAFCLAAAALGVSTIPQAAIASYSGTVRKELDIAQDRDVLCAISFGYEAPGQPVNAFRTTRATVADTLDWRGG